MHFFRIYWIIFISPQNHNLTLPSTVFTFSFPSVCVTHPARCTHHFVFLFSFVLPAREHYQHVDFLHTLSFSLTFVPYPCVIIFIPFTTFIHILYPLHSHDDITHPCCTPTILCKLFFCLSCKLLIFLFVYSDIDWIHTTKDKLCR